MTYQDYENKRNALIDEANALILDGNFDDSEAKMNEVKDLDEKWDKIAEAQANLEALNGEKRVVKVEDNTKEAAAPIKKNTVQFVPTEINSEDEGAQLYASKEYANAFAKLMMGKKLSAKERETVDIVNAYTHTSETHGVVIPQTISTAMWDKIEEQHPYYGDVSKTFVKGGVTILLDGEETDAAFYDEDTATAEGKIGVDSLKLNAYDLAKNVVISWRLKEMSVENFLQYIQSRLAKKIGAALGYACVHGKGSDYDEPEGVITKLLGETNTPQVGTYTSGSLSFADLTGARAKISVDAKNAAVYANNATIWSELANVLDEDGRPLFLADPANNGIYRVLGMEVKEDDAFTDGEILISSAEAGYAMNLNKDASLLSQDDVVKRTTTYAGYALVDGGVTYSKAHSLLKLGE